MNENENPMEPEISPELAALAMMLGDVQRELRQQRALLLGFAKAAGHPLVAVSTTPETQGLADGLAAYESLVRQLRGGDGEDHHPRPRGPDAPFSGG